MVALTAWTSFFLNALVSLRYNRPYPLVLATLAGLIGLDLVASVRRFTRQFEERARRALPVAVALFTAVLLFLFAQTSGSLARHRHVPSWPGRWGAVAVGLIAASYAKGRGPGPRWRFPAIASVSAALGAWVIVAWPPPNIDVLPLQRDACAQLLAGIDPYAAAHPGIPWNPEYDGEAVRLGGGLRSFPYPPASLLLVLPGHLLGDVRWSLLAATLGAAFVMVAAGRRLGLPPGHFAELAAVAFLFQPQALLVLHFAWTEPLLILATALAVWAMAAGRGRLAGLALAAVVALKQSGLLWIVPAGASGRLRLRDGLAGLAVAATIASPFLLWDPAAFWLGNATYHLASRSRPDSLSIPAAIQGATGVRPPTSLGFLAAGACAAVVLRRAGPGLARPLLGGAAVFLAFFLFGKAGHLNYYWFAGSQMALAFIAGCGEGREKDGRSRADHRVAGVSAPHLSAEVVRMAGQNPRHPLE